MKERLVGKNKNYSKSLISGFSTLELMIAFALICIVLVGTVSASFASQYWGITAQTANEGLYKAKTALEDLRSLVKEDFYQAVSTPLTKSEDPTDSADTSCIEGGLCYYVQKTITDLSSCSKYVEAKVEWQVENYPKSTTKLFTYLTNSSEIIARGGDCILNEPSGDWENNNPESVGQISFNPTGKQFTGIDVIHKKIYTTSNTSPYFTVYSVPPTIGNNPTQISLSTDIVKVLGLAKSLNAVDVEEDLATGRTYAFVAVHSTTKQLAVIDVTDASNPSLVAQRDLQNVSSSGSYPEGWRVFVYGGRLYLTTRETAGNEFHIFNISTPTIPAEIGNGFALDRTVNDMIVREQKIGGVVHRLVYLASDSNLKEFSILDVTNDTVTEISEIDLPGDQDGLSLSLLGNNLYLGRQSNTSGPELYVFDVSDSSNPSLKINQWGEVGADVRKIEVSGRYAYIGTSKSGQEFQVWDSDFSEWNGSLNVGRFTSYSFPHLALLGFDINVDWIYLISQNTTSDKLGVIYTP